MDLPRPIWSLIMEFLGPIGMANVERSCKTLYEICNPECNCKTDRTCYGFWKSEGLDCKKSKRQTLKKLAKEKFLDYLYGIRNQCCEFNMHIVHVKDKDFYQCFYCRKAYRQSSLCGYHCFEHSAICVTPTTKLIGCRAHSCPFCFNSDAVKQHNVVQAIVKECSRVTINKNGKKTEHEIIFRR